MGTKNNSLVAFFALILPLGFTACGSGSAGSSGSITGGGSGVVDFTTTFDEVNRASPALAGRFNMTNMLGGPGTNLMAVAAPNPMQGLYFGELEVTAYMRNAGAVNDLNNPAGGFVSSIYDSFVILQSGHEKARNNLLKFGEQLDINALNGAYKSIPSVAYMTETRAFSIDWLEVYAYRTGVVYNNVFYGIEAGDTVPVGSGNNVTQAGILYKYPELAGIPEISTAPKFPGVDRDQNAVQDVNILFVRDDWFSEPVVVLMDRYVRGQIESSSKVLTAQQQALITEFVMEGTNRRSYENLVIVPMSEISGSPKINFPNVSDLPVKTVGKNQVPDTSLFADNVKISIDFDLSDILAAPLDWTQGQTSVQFKGDANSVPFGLRIKFANKK